MKPTVKVFTKDNPCTKIDIWNCFRRADGFASVQVDVAHSIIGKNVPRVMERDEKITVLKTNKGDFYKLTEFGREWLEKGIRAFLKNHPLRLSEVEYPPEDDNARRVRRRR